MGALLSFNRSYRPWHACLIALAGNIVVAGLFVQEHVKAGNNTHGKPQVVRIANTTELAYFYSKGYGPEYLAQANISPGDSSLLTDSGPSKLFNSEINRVTIGDFPSAINSETALPSLPISRILKWLEPHTTENSQIKSILPPPNSYPLLIDAHGHPSPIDIQLTSLQREIIQKTDAIGESHFVIVTPSFTGAYNTVTLRKPSGNPDLDALATKALRKLALQGLLNNGFYSIYWKSPRENL